MVQRLKGDHKTFAEIADVLMAMILREGATSKRIDVVFDVYRETSIKNTEREKRGGYTGIEYRDIQPDHRIQQWMKFLSNPQNKKQLVRVVTEEWQKERFRQGLTGKHLFTTTKESCVEISADNFRQPTRKQTLDFFTHLMQQGMFSRLLLYHQKIPM